MESARQPRNHVIDAARATSVLVVVVFHSVLYQVRVVDGVPALVPWAPPAWPWWFVTWLLMVIPVFFIAGGYAQTLLVDRMRAQRASYGTFLAGRGRRLVGPLLFFVTVLAGVSTVVAWAGYLTAASALTQQLMQLLWFITVYLVIVALSPAAVTAHDRWGVRPMLVVFALAATVDAWSFGVGDPRLRNINMLLVWPLVHQLGIAYYRGWFRTGRRWRAWVPVAVGMGGICVLVFALHYPGSSVGLADIPIANVQPPTIAMVFLALAQCGALALVERSGVLSAVSAGFERALATVNALMMSVYLWHIGGIALAAGTLLAVSTVAPAASGILLAQPTVTLLSLLVVATLVPRLARLEYLLIPPLGAAQDTGRAIVAYAALVAGTALVWQSGTVLHPSRPFSTVGVLLVWLGSWLMRGGDGRD